MKQNSVESVVSEEKQRSECSQIFYYNSREVKQFTECSQWSKIAKLVQSVKKNSVGSIVRYFFLILVK